jgi:hypothetical protein
MQEFEQPQDDAQHRVEDDDRNDRREVETEAPERDLGDEAPEEAQVRIDDVVEEALDPVQPDVVGKRDPGRQDVCEDAQQVDVEDDDDEVLDRVDGVREQYARNGNRPYG